LHTGHLYRITLDGSPVGEASTSPLQQLHNIDRGSHRLQVEIVDAQGKTIQHSPPHTFHMMRTSLAQRRMVNPCKKDDYGVRPEGPRKDRPTEKKNIPFVPFLWASDAPTWWTLSVGLPFRPAPRPHGVHPAVWFASCISSLPPGCRQP